MTDHTDGAVTPRVLPPLDVLLVVGGNHSHDYDYVRPELIRALSAGRDIRVDVLADFTGLGALSRTATCLTYTCDLRPSPSEEAALHNFVKGGGRWLALHGSNCFFDVNPIRVPDGFETYFETVGSKFKSHPPICDFTVRPTNTPLTAQLMSGVEEFTTSDELYLLDHLADVQVLLEVGPDGPHPGAPIAYLHTLGSGQVLYCSLGHSGSPTHPHGQHRCSWAVPAFGVVLDRLVRWLIAGEGQNGARSPAL